MNKLISVRAALTVLILSQIVIACTPKQATDPASIAKGVFDAINAGKAEAGAGYFAQDAEFVCPWGQPTGATKIGTFFKTNLIPLKTHIDIQELKVEGNNLTGTFKINSVWLKNAFPNEVPLNFMVIGTIQNEKITSMTWTAAK